MFSLLAPDIKMLQDIHEMKFIEVTIKAEMDTSTYFDGSAFWSHTLNNYSLRSTTKSSNTVAEAIIQHYQNLPRLLLHINICDITKIGEIELMLAKMWQSEVNKVIQVRTSDPCFVLASLCKFSNQWDFSRLHIKSSMRMTEPMRVMINVLKQDEATKMPHFSY